MPDIVLTTFNARYAHASFGLRYLMANLGPLRERAVMLEFDVARRSFDAVEAILAQQPRIVGVGVYVWNAEASLRLVADLKRVRPDVTVIVGGPEVSYEVGEQEVCRLADFVMTGEADLAFARLCGQLLAGERPLMKVIAAELPEFDRLELPYELYADEDLAHRVVYVEASRGCPFSCEFCLSSLDVPVRSVPRGRFLAAMQRLLDRGLRHFKFVDRTFNLNLADSAAILQFFLEWHRTNPDAGLFLHFEMIPDRLPESLRAIIAQFPAGALQFEVGIQSFNEAVCERISRRQDAAKAEGNLRWLREQTGVHLHTDLIVGLPGEDVASFAAGFDRLVALRPQEIQIGLLKRLRGTPIVRHDREWGMVYSPNPPYEVMQTSVIDFPMMQRLRRFARYWDLVANSGNFIQTTPLLWSDSAIDIRLPFPAFLSFSDWLHAAAGRTHAIALPRLAELLHRYLTRELHLSPDAVGPIMARDYQRAGRPDVPDFLRPFASPVPRERSTAPKRQARHLHGT